MNDSSGATVATKTYRCRGSLSGRCPADAEYTHSEPYDATQPFDLEEFNRRALDAGHAKGWASMDLFSTDPDLLRCGACLSVDLATGEAAERAVRLALAKAAGIAFS